MTNIPSNDTIFANVKPSATGERLVTIPGETVYLHDNEPLDTAREILEKKSGAKVVFETETKSN